MRKVYLAGPFFNDEQRKTMEKIEDMMRRMDEPFFSPRLECICAPDATELQRRNAFNLNVQSILHARAVLARIDDFDPGTMWEMGYAYAAHIPTYAFTTVDNRGLNLMLAASGARLIQGWDKLERFLDGDENAAILWKKEII